MIIYLIILIILSLFLFYKIPKKHHNFSIPNYRSAHTKKKINSGGVPIIISFIIFFFIENFKLDVSFFFFLTNILMILIYGYIDDAINLNQKIKFSIQCYLSMSIIIYLYILDYELHTYEIIIIFIFSIFFINTINFIDGSDGNLSLNLIFILSNLYIYFFTETYSNLILFVILSLSIFLIFFNFPPAKIFLGESGSSFLSYVTLLILLFLYLENNINLLALFLLFSYSFSDVILTLIYRIFKYNLNASKGHRDHIYQKYTDKYGHKFNLIFVFLYNLLFITPIFHISLYYDQFIYYFVLVFIVCIPPIVMMISMKFLKVSKSE